MTAAPGLQVAGSRDSPQRPGFLHRPEHGLLDAFSRFNIPFQSGLTPSEAIPDPATTEIFVSHKP